MIVYLVIGHIDGAIYAHFTATKKQAKEHIKYCERTFDWVEVSISEYEITPTKAGVAEAMNVFIHHTALNDGG
jgi:hypothetical protein